VFEEFPKLARLSRECVITEKIDGTNAQVLIERDPHSDGDMVRKPDGGLCVYDERSGEFYLLRAGSRNRFITPEADNFGFARWAYEHARKLVTGLGEGRHFGEWWGSGIQRGYGLTNGEKRFSLFNSARWGAAYEARKAGHENTFPACCHVVPVLSRGEFTTANVEAALFALQTAGSQASPGFMNPEGVVVWHEAARVMFKKTLGGDGHKGAEKSARREAQINA
jgi:hypothetical protein